MNDGSDTKIVKTIPRPHCAKSEMYHHHHCPDKIKVAAVSHCSILRVFVPIPTPLQCCSDELCVPTFDACSLMNNKDLDVFLAFHSVKTGVLNK